MSIDSTSLSYLSQAISNSSSKKDSLSLSLKNSLQDKVNVISKAASQISTQSRYKAAFEEKMKIAFSIAAITTAPTQMASVE